VNATRLLTLSVTTSLALAAPALAQPITGTEPPPDTVVAPAPPPPLPPPPPDDHHDRRMGHGGHDDHDGHGMHGPPRRPEGMSYGLGFGYTLGAAKWSQPDVASARFRFPSGLTFEPRVAFATSSVTNKTGDDETKDGTIDFLVGTEVRIPMAARDRVDLVLVGGAQLAYAKDDPDGDNSSTTTPGFALTYGLGMDYWIGRSWTIGWTARNPILAYSHTSNEQAGDDPSSSTVAAGLVWNPGIDVTLHLYF
jgi:hypothetical protein